MIKCLKPTLTKLLTALETLEYGFDDIVAVMTLSKKYRKRLRTGNSIERLNQEIRRERVIRGG
ncbi:MAG: hypothetical protein EOM17_13220 [Synergistales bacterium]|nr:hypothetical protein [Synergistales bacterium]